MSGEPYSQKSGWIIHSNERIFLAITFKYNVSIHSVVLPVMANIAQCLIDNLERITVADREGFRSPSPLLNIP